MLIRSVLKKIMRADLTQGTFRHSSTFYSIKTYKPFKFEYLACSYISMSNCWNIETQSKIHIFLIKQRYLYHVCYHVNPLNSKDFPLFLKKNVHILLC